ncbi:4-aminobutyrate--2-oxoglutarate transaminase [Variovorax sp. J22R133]|uniref:4-aminobutyrate--2-oxoglutarate transaminase n=1 Tax=Variovorax brevis TaxID=3053503 RepID=UPI0025788153|nr:4-aminobutyrate--2-oxoglutarate transaminase [Variovorax sp. J22R133]MDM0113770.1 4-aminobutyrate--2-oxoglutarate transaminase [Variovorax sp. J22R133]
MSSTATLARPQSDAAAVTNASLDARRIAAAPRGVGIGFPIYAARARNAELWDVEGRRYIDFGSGIAVLNTGHCHPRIVEAIRAQLDCFTHTAYQVVPYESSVALAERLNRLAPGTHAKKTAFFTTGAEAVENAIKIARSATRRPGVIALTGGFHGRTFMGMALTGKVAPYKAGFGPFPGSIFHVPAPQALNGVTVDDSLRAIEHLFKSDIEAEQVAAIILEPVQGEGGFHVAPPEFMRALREICDRHGILLIADEIQTGFARTGKLFAMEHYDVLPDLMTVAKSLAGGMPLSGVIGRAEIMDAPAPGGLGGTYAGNPLAIAAAHAVLDVIEDERLNERAAHLGQRLTAHLQALRREVPRISDVRGLGAMVAMEFATADGSPDPALAKMVQQRAQAAGLLLLICGTNANVIRFLFPLTIEESIFEEGLAIVSRAVQGSTAS